MGAIFSDHFKYATWRRLWVALAKGEKAIGLPITDKQIEALERHIEEIDYEKVAQYEKELKHDVMAHLHAFGDCAKEAKGIIHLGATSAFVTDNADLLQMEAGLKLLKAKFVHLISTMKRQAKEYAATPTLAYTHLQPAQPTTVGKRICMWLQDFVFDFNDLIQKEESLYFLGVKGATGTQASFMHLLENDSTKVEKLDAHIAEQMGFKKRLTISGQTYTRKQDMRVLSVLEGIGASAHKCATDLRLIAHFGEMGEGRGKHQIGSSAMPHKINPIYSERVCGLSRLLISLCQNPAYTLATQWLERSLDDSANRRIVIPEAFLTADAILDLLQSIFSDLQIHPEAIKENLHKALPLLALENILMSAVKKGKDRQEVHKKLRENPHQGVEIAIEIGLTPEEIDSCCSPNTGRAEEQVAQFLSEMIDPLLKNYRGLKAPSHKIDV
ncbi:MAG: adenylosuccinate lyase [Verrucomicrobia bacterium]|nr:adenylosuccinate lyase [Verrucomicrobiota bacterium]